MFSLTCLFIGYTAVWKIVDVHLVVVTNHLEFVPCVAIFCFRSIPRWLLVPWILINHFSFGIEQNLSDVKLLLISRVSYVITLVILLCTYVIDGVSLRLTQVLRVIITGILQDKAGVLFMAPLSQSQVSPWNDHDFFTAHRCSSFDRYTMRVWTSSWLVLFSISYMVSVPMSYLRGNTLFHLIRLLARLLKMSEGRLCESPLWIVSSYYAIQSHHVALHIYRVFQNYQTKCMPGDFSEHWNERWIAVGTPP